MKNQAAISVDLNYTWPISWKKNIEGVSFNCGADPEALGLYTVLSACFPKTEKSEFLLMNLDIYNICASGGSACSSGADAGSHVMRALKKTDKHVTVRFSFSKYNTKEEVDRVVEKLKELVWGWYSTGHYHFFELSSRRRASPASCRKGPDS